MSSPDLLRDPIWQFIGVIAGIVIGIITGFVLPLALFRKQTRKNLMFTVISNTLILPILDVGDQARDKLQILFDGKPMSDARLVVLKLWNSGNVPIEIDDYENRNPIKFNFGDKAEVLNVEVLETTPSNLKSRVNASLKADRGNVVLEPLLLNNQDTITLKVLLSHLGNTITADETRISGIKQIQFSNQVAERNMLKIDLIYLLVNSAFKLAIWSLAAIGVLILLIVSNIALFPDVIRELPLTPLGFLLFLVFRTPGGLIPFVIYMFVVSMISVIKVSLPYYLKR